MLWLQSNCDHFLQLHSPRPLQSIELELSGGLHRKCTEKRDTKIALLWTEK